MKYLLIVAAILPLGCDTDTEVVEESPPATEEPGHESIRCSGNWTYHTGRSWRSRATTDYQEQRVSQT